MDWSPQGVQGAKKSANRWTRRLAGVIHRTRPTAKDRHEGTCKP